MVASWVPAGRHGAVCCLALAGDASFKRSQPLGAGDCLCHDAETHSGRSAHCARRALLALRGARVSGKRVDKSTEVKSRSRDYSESLHLARSWCPQVVSEEAMVKAAKMVRGICQPKSGASDGESE